MRTILTLTFLSVILLVIQSTIGHVGHSHIYKFTPISQTGSAASLAVNRIAFISDIGGGRSLYVVDPDHSDVELLGKLHAEKGRIEPATVVVSHDRKQVVFVTSHQSGAALWICNIDGSGARRLTNIMTSFRYPFFASWSPSGRRLAFVITRENFSGIFAVNADGSDFHFVTYGDRFSWSPDDHQLVLTTFVPGKPGRYVEVVDINGSNLHEISGDSRSVECSWSPDGKRIAFSESRDEATGEPKFDVFVVDPSGENKQKLFENLTLYTRLVWSPDGEFLSFVSKFEQNHGLYVLPINDSSGSKFRFFPGVDGTFAWAPDSKRIAYGENRVRIVDLQSEKSAVLFHTDTYGRPLWLPDGNGLLLFKTFFFGSAPRSSEHVDLYTTELQPQHIKRLTAENLRVSAISPSPDGKRIAFVTELNTEDGPSQSAVLVINSDGSDIRKLPVSNIQPGWFAWSPDGTRIAFLKEIANCKRCQPGSFQIAVANADGSNEHTIVREAAWNFAPAWLPDGKRIVFLSDRGSTHAAYVTNANGKGTRLLIDLSPWLPKHFTDRAANRFIPLLWSPDATKLATRPDERTGPIAIKIIDIEKRSALSIFGIEPNILSWSPDSKRIAIRDVIHAEAINSDTPSYVELVDVNDSRRDKLTLKLRRDGSPFHVGPCGLLSWSPDGKRFACEGITLFNSDGSGARWIVTGRHPAWLK
jgi:Tol biopolymer transport system component